VLIYKKQGGSGVGPYFWEKDGDGVEVPDGLALELLAIKGGGFYVPEPDLGPDPAKPDGAGTVQRSPFAPDPAEPPTDVPPAAAAAAPAVPEPVVPPPLEPTPTA
jgi:hypothetical protein